MFETAEREISVLGFSGLFLSEDSGIHRVLRTKTDAGVRVRILLGDPDSPAVAQRGTDEGLDNLVSTKIRNALVLYRPLRLADFLVAEGVVDDISHEGLRILLREEGVSFQRIKTWETSRDPDYAAKKASVEHLYAIADGEVIPEDGEPEVIFCLNEFGPLNLMPHPGRQWAERGGRRKDPDREPRRRRRATYNRYDGVRHLFAASRSSATTFPRT